MMDRVTSLMVGRTGSARPSRRHWSVCGDVYRVRKSVWGLIPICSGFKRGVYVEASSRRFGYIVDPMIMPKLC
jgi:hypothetical protein